jgi:hypothetical protein
MVEWGEFRFNELFKLLPIKNKLVKSNLDRNGNIPVYSSESENNGIVGYSNNKPFFIVNKDFPIYIVFGDHTRSFNIATKDFCVMDNVKVLSPKKIISVKSISFIISAWKRTIPNKGYSRHWSFAKNVFFQLPTKNGEIDFDFMENFISQIELERIEKVQNYLDVTGLKNYNLTADEVQVLEEFQNGKVEWSEFKIGDLFSINSYKKRFDANKITISETGNPYVVRTALNNGVRGYINEDEKFLNDGNTISFGQDTATMFYQEKPYFTGDKIKIVKSKGDFLNKTNAHFFISTMTKAFSSFSWGGSSFSVKIIENQKIKLLTLNNNQPDYEKMEILISAIQKNVIKDVVDFSFKK